MNTSYELLGIRGRNLFGTSYVARRDGPAGREVLLDLARDELGVLPGWADRLQELVRALPRVAPPGVVAPSDVVTLEGHLALETPAPDRGVDLGRVLADGASTPAVAFAVAARVAATLHLVRVSGEIVAHDLELAHGDLTPRNVVVQPSGEVRLLVYGLAPLAARALAAAGKPPPAVDRTHLPPEALDGVYGPGGDTYALGLVLCELLLGVPAGPLSPNPTRHNERVAEVLAEVGARVPAQPTAVQLLRAMLGYEATYRPELLEVQQQCEALAAAAGAAALDRWAVRVCAEHAGLPPGLAPQREHDAGTRLEAAWELPPAASPPPLSPPRVGQPSFLVPPTPFPVGRTATPTLEPHPSPIDDLPEPPDAATLGDAVAPWTQTPAPPRRVAAPVEPEEAPPERPWLAFGVGVGAIVLFTIAGTLLMLAIG